MEFFVRSTLPRSPAFRNADRTQTQNRLSRDRATHSLMNTAYFRTALQRPVPLPAPHPKRPPPRSRVPRVGRDRVARANGSPPATQLSSVFSFGAVHKKHQALPSLPRITASQCLLLTSLRARSRIPGSATHAPPALHASGVHLGYGNHARGRHDKAPSAPVN